MAINLNTNYPGKVTVDANNPNGTFKNRTSDALKDGTPYEKAWSSDVWGFLSHILGLAGVSPSGAEENETNSQYYDALDGLLGRRDVEFESKDLIINVQSVTTVDADAKRLSLLDNSFIPKFIDDLDVTWTMPTDLESGVSEEASTTYGLWVDSDLNLRLVGDIESVTDGTTAGKLVDSAAIFLTKLVHAGDIAYNLTTLQKTTVSVDATLNGEVSVVDDIFVSGDEYKIVKMSPEGIGANGERVGDAFNNSGSDFDDSHYTQIQEEKSYSELAGDFAVTTANWTTIRALITVMQINDWTGVGLWKTNINFGGSVSSGSEVSQTFAISGILFKNVSLFRQAVSDGESAGVGDTITGKLASDNTGDILLTFNGIQSLSGRWSISAYTECDKKPTFHN